MAAALPLLQRWEPENQEFWTDVGARLARRTLWITTGALTLSFSTWFMWSAIVVKLPELGFRLTSPQLFWLAAIPGLVGATLRIPYSFIVQIFGTRLVVASATASLLIPSVGIGIAVQDPTTPYGVLLFLAATAGLGGANFSAFMSSTSYYYPKARQGTALGLQAGIGNFGVSLVQLLTPLVITLPLFGPLGGAPLPSAKGAPVWIQNAALLWVLPVLFFSIAAAVGLRRIPVVGTLRQQSVIFRRKHTWLMTSLYFMTFGTFSGFSAALALLIRELFGKLEGAPDPLHYAFLGALIGSATRPLGGWISDKLGGARVTLACAVLLLASTLALPAFTKPTSAAEFVPFLVVVLVLFLAAGIGNGSTFRMIPIIFPPKEAGPVLGWTAAIAAYGAFLVPMAVSASLARFGSPDVAFYVFAAFYAVNLGICWWFYARKGAERPC
jgi:NNP family nitrate/nitrite transporter-like MFS transporter